MPRAVVSSAPLAAAFFLPTIGLSLGWLVGVIVLLWMPEVDYGRTESDKPGW